jgi:hypothetical protein
VFDGELVVLDDAGRPRFNELLFGCRRPTYVPFDLLMAAGVDLRPLAAPSGTDADWQGGRRLDCTHPWRCRRRGRALPRGGRRDLEGSSPNR